MKIELDEEQIKSLMSHIKIGDALGTQATILILAAHSPERGKKGDWDAVRKVAHRLAYLQEYYKVVAKRTSQKQRRS